MTNTILIKINIIFIEAFTYLLDGEPLNCVTEHSYLGVLLTYIAPHKCFNNIAITCVVAHRLSECACTQSRSACNIP